MNGVELSFTPSTRLRRGMQALAIIGALTFVLGLVMAPERIWPGLLLVSYYVLGIGLAGAVFVALQYVSGASWSVALRRVPEAMTGALPLGAAGLLLLLIAHPSLYPWADPAHAHDLPVFRRFWLDLNFFRVRALIYLLVWFAFTRALLRNSHRQDEDAALAHTRRNVRLSAVFLVIFAVTFWLASYDWIMSLEPDWASTIFGMYNFAGMFLAGQAALVILLAGLRRQRPLSDFVTSQHLLDLGRLLFAFSTFWMYLWFSQYMLIWYANLPDETVYLVRRIQGFWQPLMLLNVALNWVVPFLALLPRRNKQRPGVLVKVAIAVLAGHWLDLYLMTAPPFAGARPLVGFWEIGLLAGGVGLFALSFFAALRRAPLVPINDPYLAESLHYHA